MHEIGEITSQYECVCGEGKGSICDCVVREKIITNENGGCIYSNFIACVEGRCDFIVLIIFHSFSSVVNIY